MIQFNEKTLLKKQKLFAILSWEQYSLRKLRVYCLHLISVKIQGLAGKFTVTEQLSLPGFDINTTSKAHNLPIDINKNVKCTNLGSVRN